MFHAVLLSFALLLATPALAHDVAKGPNGGLYADAGTHHLELVVEPERLVVYVNDAKDAPVPVAGATGEVTVLVGREARKVSLTPAGANWLEGAVSGLTGPAVVVVALSLPDAKPRARFEVKP